MTCDHRTVIRWDHQGRGICDVCGGEVICGHEWGSVRLGSGRFVTACLVCGVHQ